MACEPLVLLDEVGERARRELAVDAGELALLVAREDERAVAGLGGGGLVDQELAELEAAAAGLLDQLLGIRRAAEDERERLEERGVLVLDELGRDDDAVGRVRGRDEVDVLRVEAREARCTPSGAPPRAGTATRRRTGRWPCPG